MTGEIHTAGKVLPIGGLKRNCLRRRMPGIHTVLILEHNQADVEEFSSEIIGGLSILPVKIWMRCFVKHLELVSGRARNNRKWDTVQEESKYGNQKYQFGDSVWDHKAVS